MNSFKEGLLYLYAKMKLYKEVVACYMQAQNHEGLIAFCKKLGDVRKGGDPSLWADLLKYFGELGEDCSKEVKEVLTYIERDDIVQPIAVLQTLSRNPCLTLSVIKDYIARKLDQLRRIRFMLCSVPGYLLAINFFTGALSTGMACKHV